MGDHLLSTVDNPYNPHTHFDEWFAFDTMSGYDTLNLLARVAITSDTLSDAENDLIVEMAMEEIVRENVSGVHRLVAAPGK